MSQGVLPGFPEPPARRKSNRTPAKRHHNRRKAWEEYIAPQLWADSLLGGAEIEVSVRDLQAGAVELIRAAKVKILAERHAHMLELHRPGDPCDEHADRVEMVFALVRFYREEMLAARGLRHVSAGVYPVDPRKPWGRHRFRPWNPTTQRNEHHGYFEDETSARKFAARWWKEEHGLDIEVPFPDWLEELFRIAVAERAKLNETPESTA